MESQSFVDTLDNIFAGSLPDLLLKFIVAIGIVVLGILAARFLTRILRRAMVRGKVDTTLVSFVSNVLYYALLVVVVVVALSYLGVPTSSLVAVLGAATLAIGLALQDSIANLAAGLSIIALRPIGVGDYVEISGEQGFVTEARLFHTMLTTRDNKSIYVPNKDVMGNTIINYSDTELIRLDLVYGISYSDDIGKAKRILQEIIDDDERVAEQPPAMVAVKELADNSVNLVARPWVRVEDQPGVTFAVTEQVKLRFDQEGLSFPFPQRDVHLFQAN
ncbi:MAG: mechanosensitive ion channel [Chloroflexota bacterium]|jgi:small conductance mechanosensitive channel